ncbi:MAG TPA: TylF/MycF/NovP-related O-methyltransferase [Acidimicrobiales bacterium]|nr:TylF/MycF/NovP-related O-methyltransferase [Acidimicrobiales bacterium]
MRGALNSVKHRTKVALMDLLAAAFARLSGAGDDQGRYAAAEEFTRRVYPDYVFSEFGRTWLADEDFFAYYRSFDDTNLHSADRKYLLRELLKLTVRLEGDFAECGVYEGATALLLCDVAASTGRRVHLFDSFSGLSAPGEHDGRYWTGGDLAASEAVLRSRLRTYDELVTVHPGWIPERFGDVADTVFALVHIDVDLYQPTLDSLRFFYPRLVPGGLIVCDDYGFTTCPGARAAVDEYFGDRPEPVLHLPTGQALVVRTGS